MKHTADLSFTDQIILISGIVFYLVFVLFLAFKYNAGFLIKDEFRKKIPRQFTEIFILAYFIATLVVGGIFHLRFFDGLFLGMVGMAMFYASFDKMNSK